MDFRPNAAADRRQQEYEAMCGYEQASMSGIVTNTGRPAKKAESRSEATIMAVAQLGPSHSSGSRLAPELVEVEVRTDKG